MNRLSEILFRALIASIVAIAALPALAAPPNVVLIFVDDLGYGDIGCYGATKVQTPNIDRLAKEGRRFTDVHSASAVCTPSRYGLLTGEYPLRALGGKGLWGPAPITSPLLVNPEKRTIADVFKSSGYDTAVIGKWHLGFKKGKNDWQEPLRPGPQDLGFDYYFGMPVVNSAPPYVYVENDRIVGADPADPLVYLGRNAKGATPITPIPPEAANRSRNAFGGAKEAHKLFNDYQVGTTFAKKSVEWIKGRNDKPFFLYLATTNIHHPFTPAKRFQGTSQCGLYGDFIHELDWIVGEVVKALEEKGVADNTLIIFTSDNGGMFNYGGQAAFKAGHRINGDLLGFKFGVWEGGHRIPFIVKWPGKIKAGSTSTQTMSGVDLFATFAAITGQAVDKKQAVDSVNMLPALVGDPEEPIREHLILAPNKGTHLSVRQGKWMYIPKQGSGGFGGKTPSSHTFAGPPAATFVGSVNSDIENGKIKKGAPPAQLYDLESDRAQTKNVYGENPEIVKQMQTLLSTYRPKAGNNSKPRRPGKKPPSKPTAGPTQSNTPRVSAARPPNFIVVFADDLGYGDLSCYGPTGVKTPHLDKLATEGFRSTDFFVPANVCSPSRASLLTGRYPMRCGLPVARNDAFPKYKNYGFLSEEITIPEMLKPAGYRSLMVGKWHMGFKVEGSHPLDAGFDEYLGLPTNPSSRLGPDFSTLYRGRQAEVRKVDFTTLTKRYTDEVVSFIERQKDEPFFIYVSHHIVHNPLVPSKEFVGTSKKGRYGDYIKELDHSTGRIMKALRDAGVDDNTLVVFTSDNGPTGPGSAGGLQSGKYCTMEGGHRVPGIFRWPGKIPAGQVSGATLTSMDLLRVFCDLAGVELPTDRKIDGKNIVSILRGESTESPHEAVYYYNGTNLQAVREGDWKLHLPRTAKDQPFWSNKPSKKKGFVTLDEPALFNLKVDRGEKRNVAAQHPDIMARLQKRAEAIRAELGDVRVTGSDQRKINLVDPQER